MTSMYSLILFMNDRCLELNELLKELDVALSQTVEIETIYEDETGKHVGTMNVLDEDSVSKLRSIQDELTRIIGG